MPELETTGHTSVFKDADGAVHTQHYGAEHVVEGSVQIIEVPHGMTVFIRHVAPTE